MESRRKGRVSIKEVASRGDQPCVRNLCKTQEKKVSFKHWPQPENSVLSYNSTSQARPFLLLASPPSPRAAAPEDERQPSEKGEEEMHTAGKQTKFITIHNSPLQHLA